MRIAGPRRPGHAVPSSRLPADVLGGISEPPKLQTDSMGPPLARTRPFRPRFARVESLKPPLEVRLPCNQIALSVGHRCGLVSDDVSQDQFGTAPAAR